MNTGADCDWDRYKDWKQKYKKRIRYRSSGSWRKYTTGIECQHQANRVRKVLSNQPKQILGTLRRPDDTFTGSPEEAERLLLETHFPDCKFVQNMEWTEESTNANEENWAIAYRVVTTDKTRWAINTFHPFKSAGPDGVFPALLQWGGETLLALLTIIFRACLAHGYVPRGWREVKVIFIPKPGKCDYSNPRSYRPISLTSFVLKTLERLCEKELRENYLQKLPLHPNQHAYSQGKCTDSALQAVVSVIESAISDKGFCLGTFLDIEGAFDKTKFIKIKEALQRHGVCTTLRNWIGNMLQGRILLLVEGESQKAIVAKGCPQGGVISPLLWNMVVNDLITALNDHRYYTVGYADAEVCNNNNNVTLQWIKGHSGSRGNDAADEMARRGSEMAAIGPEPIVPLPTAWPTSVIRQHTKELHNKYWMEVRQLKAAVPFAVCGAGQQLEVRGRRVRGRLYPWGVVEVENPDHCDFIKLRTMLITHMQDLQEVTQEVHYENYRSERLARNGQIPKRHTSNESGLSESDTGLTNGSNEDSTERERALREKEAELRRMQEMLEQMQRQMQLQAAANSTSA
ncbi:unnamed protein product [Euphydryas editha]|uniref:Reverse transcriptase domain-containing protein n=1 Tax=Euphydryas editha TaxID=104508 RepID=A0AAU9U322_EUPED|nr:unnamed protein product [Euphydryas editha]